MYTKCGALFLVFFTSPGFAGIPTEATEAMVPDMPIASFGSGKSLSTTAGNQLSLKGIIVQPVYVSGVLTNKQNKEIARSLDKGTFRELQTLLNRSGKNIEIRKTMEISGIPTSAYFYIPREEPTKERSLRQSFSSSMRELHNILKAVRAKLGETGDAIPLIILDNPHLYRSLKFHYASAPNILITSRDIRRMEEKTGKSSPLSARQPLILMGNANSNRKNKSTAQLNEELFPILLRASRQTKN